MDFRTKVDVPDSSWKISPCERMLFVGSCFADNIGQRFIDWKFRALVNPFGVMYNPVSVFHSVKRLQELRQMPFTADEPGTVVITLGTNHVYVLRATGEIVDNCQKRPQNLFEEHILDVETCAKSICEAIDLLHQLYPQLNVLLTVSPIRYRKYGYHASQLSKSVLLLATDAVVNHYKASSSSRGHVDYFPSYELINDELRDYRFYKSDMIHPSDQAVDYIWERLSASYFSDDTLRFLQLYEPIRKALAHRPFHPESDTYRQFMNQVQQRLTQLREQYPQMPE
ncbi:MAG: GSCFA domain-containing protein [Prevotella sp.]|jgi:hypothetical protein